MESELIAAVIGGAIGAAATIIVARSQLSQMKDANEKALRVQNEIHEKATQAQNDMLLQTFQHQEKLQLDARNLGMKLELLDKFDVIFYGEALETRNVGRMLGNEWVHDRRPSQAWVTDFARRLQDHHDALFRAMNAVDALAIRNLHFPDIAESYSHMLRGQQTFLPGLEQTIRGLNALPATPTIEALDALDHVSPSLSSSNEFYATWVILPG